MHRLSAQRNPSEQCDVAQFVTGRTAIMRATTTEGGPRGARADRARLSRGSPLRSKLIIEVVTPLRDFAAPAEAPDFQGTACRAFTMAAAAARSRGLVLRPRVDAEATIPARSTTAVDATSRHSGLDEHKFLRRSKRDYSTHEATARR